MISSPFSFNNLNRILVDIERQKVFSKSSNKFIVVSLLLFGHIYNT